MTKYKIILFLFIVLLIAGCDQSPDENEQEEANDQAGEQAETPAPVQSPTQQVPTAQVALGTTILADGRLESVNPLLPLGFSSSGKLVDLFFKAGDTVEEGDLLAILDDEMLQEAVTSAELQVRQAENSLTQVEMSLNDLLNWEPDPAAVALAEANLTAAEAALENASNQDAAAGNSLTSARVSLEQAQRGLADAQEAYDKAWDPARDWELDVPGRKEFLEAEREAAANAVQNAEDNVAVARSNYSLASAGLNDSSRLNAEASLANARQALEQAHKGPQESEIAAARLSVAAAELALEQALFNLEQAKKRLNDSHLYAPSLGTVLSVDAAVGVTVGPGTPVLTLIDSHHLQFQTVNLSERDLAQIAPGQPVLITLKAYPSQPISGVIAFTIPQSSGSVGDAATFAVVMELDENNLMLFPGMTGRVEIEGRGQ